MDTVSPSMSDAGCAFLYRGSGTGPLSAASGSECVENALDHYGIGVGCAGDVDGDALGLEPIREPGGAGGVGQVEDLAAAAGAWSTLIYLLAYGGPRWGEAVALRRSRCDLLRSRLHITESASEAGGRLVFGPTKTYDDRTIIVPGFLRSLLAEHLATQTGPEESALVFTAPEGGPLRHANFYKRVWRPAKQAAGVPDGLRIHDLRHTCAALLIAHGASPKAIQAHLGHSSIQVTFDRYGHLFPEDLEDLAARLETLQLAAGGGGGALRRCA